MVEQFEDDRLGQISGPLMQLEAYVAYRTGGPVKYNNSTFDVPVLALAMEFRGLYVAEATARSKC